MYFEDETTAILSIADYISSAASGLFTTTKYIYALGGESSRHCDIKDVFRIILNNIHAPQRLDALRLDLSCCAAMEAPEYQTVYDLILYSFAVRLPLLTRIENSSGLTDEQVSSIYETVMLGHVVNPGGFISDDLSELRRRIKRRRPIPPYKTDWFRAYIYANCAELADISNKNVFLMGAVEPLFSMFYLRLEQELRGYILSLSAKTTV